MPEKKILIFAFRGDPMCFVHVLLNGIDLHERGMGGHIIVEGDAVTIIPKIADADHFLNSLFVKAKDLGIFKGACRACSAKLKVTKEIENEDIPLIGDMAGHPSMGGYLEKGYEVVTF